MGLWRCQRQECSEDAAGRLIFDFEIADGQPPVCPKCKSDPRRPEHRRLVIRLECIHLHVKDANGPDIGHGDRWRVACGGSMKGRRVSAEPAAVNCPKCKASAEYAQLAADNPEILPDYNGAVELDGEKGVITIAGK